MKTNGKRKKKDVNEKDRRIMCKKEKKATMNKKEKESRGECKEETMNEKKAWWIGKERKERE